MQKNRSAIKRFHITLDYIPLDVQRIMNIQPTFAASDPAKER